MSLVGADYSFLLLSVLQLFNLWFCVESHVGFHFRGHAFAGGGAEQMPVEARSFSTPPVPQQAGGNYGKRGRTSGNLPTAETAT